LNLHAALCAAQRAPSSIMLLEAAQPSNPWRSLHKGYGISLIMCVVLALSMQASWSLDQCKSCGKNVLSDTTNTDGIGLSAEQCYIPAGWGTEYDPASRQLIANRCSNGTYGSPEALYGLGASPCKVRRSLQSVSTK
jgi:hypothetical protein